MKKDISKSAAVINIYDFDNTIYNGDSTLDFYTFCIRQNVALLRYLPYQLWHLMWYVVKLENKTTFKSHFFIFIRGINDITTCVDRFWDKNYKNIKDWYMVKDHSRDVIISSSPDFLLSPAASRLQAHTLIATKMDGRTGSIVGQNCYGKEKVARLTEVFPNPIVEEAYSDHLSDTPLVMLAKKQYFVKGNKILPFQDYRNMSRLKALFLR